MRMENVYFEKVKDPIKRDKDATLSASGNIYSQCTGTTDKNSGTVFDPRRFYQYKVDATKDVPSIVKSQAGPQDGICT